MHRTFRTRGGKSGKRQDGEGPCKNSLSVNEMSKKIFQGIEIWNKQCKK